MQTGSWITGARGSVATTAPLGLLALRAGLAEPTGRVTWLPLAHAGLPGRSAPVVGNCDVYDLPLRREAGLLTSTWATAATSLPLTASGLP